MTSARQKWLATLEAAGVASRPGNSVGYDTMQFLWTQWAYSNGQETISQEEFLKRFPPGSAEHSKWDSPWQICGEMLTEEGRRVLTIAKEFGLEHATRAAGSPRAGRPLFG
jgi:hypothetical protein